MKNLYRKNSTPLCGNQKEDQDLQHLLNKADIPNMTPLMQHDKRAYQRLSGDDSRPPQSQPQDQEAGRILGDGPDQHEYKFNSQGSGDPADSFELRSLNGVNERTWRTGGAG